MGCDSSVIRLIKSATAKHWEVCFLHIARVSRWSLLSGADMPGEVKDPTQGVNVYYVMDKSLNQSYFSTRMVSLEYKTEHQEHALCMNKSLLGRNVVHYEKPSWPVVIYVQNITAYCKG